MITPRWSLAVLAAVIGFAVFLNTRDSEFVYDDLTFVQKNESVIGEAGAFAAPTPAGRPELGLYRPVTVLTYRWTYDRVGLDAAAFHVVNAVLHGLACGLVVLFAAALGAAATAAGVAGLLFAVHPVHAEAVAWIVGRAEILALLFSLLAALAWGTPDGPRPSRRAVLAAILFAAAALSKETALPLPAFLVALDALRRPRPALGSVVRRALPLALVCVAIVALRYAVLGRFGPDTPPFTPLAELTPLDRIRLAVVIPGRALLALLWPQSLSIHYEVDDLGGVMPVLIGAATLGAIGFISFRAWRTGAGPVARGAALFLVALLPFLHLVPIGAIYADRFLYLPSAGFLIAISGAVLSRDGRASAPRTIAAIVVIAVFAGLTIVRNDAFRTNFTLWRDAEQKDPSAALPAYQLGYFYQQADLYDYQSGSQRGALYWWRESLTRDPRHLYAQEAHLQLGMHAAGALGDAKAAAEHYRKAIGLDASRVDALLNLAALETSPEVTTDEARALLRHVFVLDPNPEERAAAEAMLRDLEE